MDIVLTALTQKQAFIMTGAGKVTLSSGDLKDGSARVDSCHPSMNNEARKGLVPGF